MRAYSKKYDALYDSDTGIWLEDKCDKEYIDQKTGDYACDITMTTNKEVTVTFGSEVAVWITADPVGVEEGNKVGKELGTKKERRYTICASMSVINVRALFMC